MTTAFDALGYSSAPHGTASRATSANTPAAAASGSAATSAAPGTARFAPDAAQLASEATNAEVPATFDAWLAELSTFGDASGDAHAARASARPASPAAGDGRSVAEDGAAPAVLAGLFPWLPPASIRPDPSLAAAGSSASSGFAAAGGSRNGAASGPPPTTLPLELLGSSAGAGADPAHRGADAQAIARAAAEALADFPEADALRSVLEPSVAVVRTEFEVAAPDTDLRSLGPYGLGGASAPPAPAEHSSLRPPSAASLPHALPVALQVPVGAPAWSDELAAVLNLMVDRGEQTATLRLSPEHLGPLEVRIAVREGEASVWFGATQAETRQALESSLSRLRELLASTGLALTQAGVSGRDPRAGGQGSSGSPGSAIARAADEHAATSQTAAAELRIGAQARLARLLDVYA